MAESFANKPRKTERRLAFVILLTSTLPLVVAILLANSLLKTAASMWFRPEVGTALNQSVDLYKDYVRITKDDLRHQALAVSRDTELARLVRLRDSKPIIDRIDYLVSGLPSVAAVQVDTVDGRTLAARTLSLGSAESNARRLEVVWPVTEDTILRTSFVVARTHIDELARTGEIAERYNQAVAFRSDLYSGYMSAYVALLGITMLGTVILGIVLARGVTRRIHRLGIAIQLVADGDFSVRVPVTGSDELTELARTFNEMIGEMGRARARIEFLQRMGAWQEMAQRLAHEIKNPLTPIQLAVQECHRKYDGENTAYRKLLGTTREIVEEEVQTLRRLVSNFSNFARLPHAELKEAVLNDFLTDCRDTMGHLEDPSLGEESADADPLPTDNVRIEWEIPKVVLHCAIDKQMLRRVLINLVRNAVQALRDEKKLEGGRVRVRAHAEGEGARIEIDDNGPGVPLTRRNRIFDPYFTTKADGTGLGLAIVKKIVVEHNGTIEVGTSEWGGAQFVLRLPGVSTLEAMATKMRTIEQAMREGLSTTEHTLEIEGQPSSTRL